MRPRTASYKVDLKDWGKEDADAESTEGDENQAWQLASAYFFFPVTLGTDRDSSPFLSSHTWHRSRFLSSFFPVTLCTDRDSSPFLSSHTWHRSRFLSSFFPVTLGKDRDSSRCPPIHLLPLPHEPYVHEAVPPRCVNLYLFHFSTQLRSVRRGFHLTPSIRR